MLEAERGFRCKLEEKLNVAQPLEIKINISGPAVYDFTCFGVDKDNKLSDDRYMIFYNQLASPGQEITLQLFDKQANFSVNLQRLPQSIEKLVFAASIDGSGTMRDIGIHNILITQNGQPVINSRFTGDMFRDEKAIIAMEIYRKGVWRISFVGQGFAGGLSDLLKNYGGEEDSGPEPAPAPAASAPAAVGYAAAPPAQAAQSSFASAPPRPQAAPAPVSGVVPVSAAAQSNAAAGGMITCPSCGRTVRNVKFCSECGTPLGGGAPRPGAAAAAAAGTVGAAAGMQAAGAAPASSDPLSVSRCKVGDIVEFGRFPNDYDGKKVPIEWQVIDIKNNNAMLLAKYCLSSSPYSRGSSNPGPDKSEVHSWLNGEFLQQAFNDEEKRRFLIVRLSGQIAGLKRIKEDSQADIQANVFLLSAAELLGLMPDDDGGREGGSSAARVCKCTSYACSKGAIPCGGAVNWWLRSSCDKKASALCVSPRGNIGSRMVSSSGCGIRPALWVTLKP